MNAMMQETLTTGTARKASDEQRISRQKFIELCDVVTVN